MLADMHSQVNAHRVAIDSVEIESVQKMGQSAADYLIPLDNQVQTCSKVQNFGMGGHIQTLWVAIFESIELGIL